VFCKDKNILFQQKENKKKKVNKQEKVEKTKNEPCPVFRDCEFLVVQAISSGLMSSIFLQFGQCSSRAILQ
jgi:hypothetical protein